VQHWGRDGKEEGGGAEGPEVGMGEGEGEKRAWRGPGNIVPVPVFSGPPALSLQQWQRQAGQ
jgi:hypothetical protein